MTYLSIEDILEIHSFIIDETGGSHGLRDRGSLLATVALPAQTTFGHELYPTIFAKAAVYTRNIIFSHPFIDGNKRTAMTVAAVFLEDNGHEFVAPQGEIERFALEIIENHLDIEAIALWLKRHSKKKGKKRKSLSKS